MSFVTLRHFTEADIPLRSELLREARFLANLTDFGMVMEEDALVERQRKTIHEEHETRRFYTLCGPEEQVIGFAWISSIDWRSQSCELSFGILPRYRGYYGAPAVAVAHDYLRNELNMRVTVNQVLDHNTMMHSARQLAIRQRVRCPYDSFTVGEWRAACYWSETDDDIEVERDQAQKRRRAVAQRIRAMSTP